MDEQEIQDQFKAAWMHYLEEGYDALEEEEIASVMLHLSFVEEADYSQEQTRFMRSFSERFHQD